MSDTDNIEYYLDRMRGAGWRIAVHNDYIQDGKLMTFYCFNKPSYQEKRATGRFVKGEADNDFDAITACWALAGRP